MEELAQLMGSQVMGRLFDKGPTKHHADALDLIRWCCPTTAQWVTSVSRVAAIINERPDPAQPPAEEKARRVTGLGPAPLSVPNP